jgi:hypothetical protein
MARLGEAPTTRMSSAPTEERRPQLSEAIRQLIGSFEG